MEKDKITAEWARNTANTLLGEKIKKQTGKIWTIVSMYDKHIEYERKQKEIYTVSTSKIVEGRKFRTE